MTTNLNITKTIHHYKETIVIILVTIIFFIPVLFQDKTAYAFDVLYSFLPWSSYVEDNQPNNKLITDPINVFYPARHHFHKQIKKGILPFWNKLNFCGRMSSPNTNPLLLGLYTFLPTTIAHDVLLILLLCFTGLFSYKYLKFLKLKSIAALIGALTWMFNGYVMVWFEFENVSLIAFSLPVFLYVFEKWLVARGWRPFLLIVGAFALILSTGYTHLIVYQGLFIIAYTIIRLFSQYHIIRIKLLSKSFLFICIAFLFALLLNVNMIIKEFGNYKSGQRKPQYTKALFQETGQLPGRYLVTLLFPDFFGSPARDLCFTPKTTPNQSYNNYNELCIYVGIMSFFLALASLICINSRIVAFYWITALLSLLMAMGSPLYLILVRIIPGLGLSTPTRVLYLWGFSLSILAAFGADNLLRKKMPKVCKICLSFTWIFIGIIMTGVFFIMQFPKAISWAIGNNDWIFNTNSVTILKQHFSLTSQILFPSLILGVLSCLLLITLLFSKNSKNKFIILCMCLVVIAFDLISFGMTYNTFAPRNIAFPPTKGVLYLQKDPSPYRILTFGNFLHNSFAPFEIEDIGGYSSFYSQRYGNYLHLCQKKKHAIENGKYNRWVSFSSFGSPLFDLVNCKYVLTPLSLDIDLSHLQLVYTNEIKIYKNNKAFSRAFFVPTYILCETEDAIIDFLDSATSEVLKRTVALEKKPATNFPSSEYNKNEIFVDNTPVNIVSYSSHKIVLQYKALKNGFIVLSDMYHPFWKVKVNGKNREIIRGNYIMRAIPIKTGDNLITLQFKPTAFIIGFYMSLIGWVVLFCIFLFPKIIRLKTLIQSGILSLKKA